MSDDKVKSLFGGAATPVSAPAANPPARVYNIKLKDGTLFESLTGYLSINGLFAVLTETPNDAMAVTFYALMEDIQYIVESDEVLTEDAE